jgi:hypothetical protein
MGWCYFYLRIQIFTGEASENLTSSILRPSCIHDHAVL